MMSGSTTSTFPREKTANLILDYYDKLARVIDHYIGDPAPVRDAEAFSPGYLLPPRTPRIEEFFAVATATWRSLGEYRGHRLSLLDLTGNPGTNTTKTFASLLMVARAVEYIRRTGEPILMLTPTSGNKGIALRDAVERALSTKLVCADQLAVAVLAPQSAREKFRDSLLSSDQQLRSGNPVLIYEGGQPEEVKNLGRGFARKHAKDLAHRGRRLWYSLDLSNYVVADASRAFFEQQAAPTGKTTRRLHAHAVSSAFGLLGYNLGREVLEAAGQASADDRPGFLLVQHLATPDMVLSLRHGNFDRAAVPHYTKNSSTGLYEQSTDPRFPFITHDPNESLDPTFYTHQPTTSVEMNRIIGRYGGDGIVVSRQECLSSYPSLRFWCDDLPANPRSVREWSLVMVLTGVRSAIDRKLIDPDREVVVHGSGFYTTEHYRPLRDTAITPVRTVEDIAEVLLGRATTVGGVVS